MKIETLEEMNFITTTPHLRNGLINANILEYFKLTIFPQILIYLFLSLKLVRYFFIKFLFFHQMIGL